MVGTDLVFSPFPYPCESLNRHCKTSEAILPAVLLSKVLLGNVPLK